MNLTYTKRALKGAGVVLVLGAILLFRNGARDFTGRDYMLIGAALVLIALNIGGSYYFDRRGVAKN